MHYGNDKNNDLLLINNYPAQPAVEIAALQAAFSRIGTRRSFKKGDEIYAVREEEKCIYLFKKTLITFTRVNDGLAVYSGKDVGIFGIAECLSPNATIFLKLEEDCDCWAIPFDKAVEIFTQKHLWQSVAALLAWFLQMLCFRDVHMVGVSAYVMIRSKLIELNTLDADLRSSMNVADYIQDRTQLARSTIMAILKELRRGNYIEIKRGKLIAIRLLPKEY